MAAWVISRERYRKRLNQVSIAAINGVDQLGIVVVFVVMSREKDQLGALFPGLPDCLGGLDLKLFGRLVFGQNDAVTAVGVAADSHRLVPEVGVVQKLHRGVKAVQVAVQNGPVHGIAPFMFIIAHPFEKSNPHVFTWGLSMGGSVQIFLASTRPRNTAVATRKRATRETSQVRVFRVCSWEVDSGTR